MLDFKMMRVQAIRLNAEIYLKIVRKQDQADILNSFVNSDSFDIKWIDNFTDKYRKFRSFKSLTLPLDMPDKTHLIADLGETQRQVNAKYNLATSLNVKESRLSLLYDPRFFQFFSIYELHFSLPEEPLITLLQGSLLNQQKTDLYNTLRQMIVKESWNRR